MRTCEPYVKLIHSTPDPELVIERMGRLCWKSEGRAAPGSHVAFIDLLISRGHTSVLEHASAGFIIGCDRGISHELVRHRLASFSQTSTRYCNYGAERFGQEITVVRPSQVEVGSDAHRHWVLSCQEAERRYLLMLRGTTPQNARSVLPTCLLTEIGMTANLREWRLILEQRLSPRAHPDMRVIARLLRDELVTLAPTVFAAFQGGAE